MAISSGRPDDNNPISLLTSASYADFELPNTTNLEPLYPLEGTNWNALSVQSRFPDNAQAKQNYYAVVSYQHSAEKLNFQFSPYFRLGRIDYTPDLVRDLVFRMWPNTRSRILQPADHGSICLLTADHTIRAGLLQLHTASPGAFYTNSRNMQPSIWITSPSRTSVRT